MSLNDPIFNTGGFAAPVPNPGHDLAAIKTYRYLRLGMVVAVAVLGYSVLEEYYQPGVHCFLGSLSGYYYTPVHGVFISVMVAIGLALIVIKGRTTLEDASLSLAGIMAPLVAFVPTSDDVHGVCRGSMLRIGHYQPDPGSQFIPASISNNLHALAGAAGGSLVVFAIALFVLVRLKKNSPGEYTRGTWINLGVGIAVVMGAWSLLLWGYSWLLQAHAYAACTMFVFLAVAALANSWSGFKKKTTSKWYAWLYGCVGAAMLTSGIVFVVLHGHSGSLLGGHLVLAIEALEVLLFLAFWVVQTVERWNATV